MTTPWNNFGAPTSVEEPPAQAPQHQTPSWQQAPVGQHPHVGQQPAFQQFPQAQAPHFNQGGMPPQGPGFGGYPGFQPQAPKPNKMPLIISLIVAAVLLIGGGVTTFLLLNKKTEAAPGGDTKGAGVVTDTKSTDAPSTGADKPTKSSDAPTEEPTKDTPTKEEPTKSSEAPTTTSDAPTEDPSSAGGGDMNTAQGLVENWLGFVNEGDYETASQLVCQAEQQGFIDGFDGQSTPNNKLVMVDMQWDGDNVALTLTAEGSTASGEQINLTMWPTNTGYFLICSNPLSDADLNW